MNHQLQEVFKFACGLTENRAALLDFIYTGLIQYILQQTDFPLHMFDYDVSFLKSLLKEIPEDMKFDPLHNRYINYATENDTKVFVPSKVYIFGPQIMSQNLIIQQHPEAVEPARAECLMKLEDEDGSEVLKILEKIGSYNQDVSISYLDWKNVWLKHSVDMINLARKTLKIRENITSIRTFSCEISPAVYERVVTKLQDCDKLQRLDPGGSQSLNIDKAITASTSLRELYLYECKIQPEVYQDIIWQL